MGAEEIVKNVIYEVTEVVTSTGKEITNTYDDIKEAISKAEKAHKKNIKRKITITVVDKENPTTRDTFWGRNTKRSEMPGGEILCEKTSAKIGDRVEYDYDFTRRNMQVAHGTVTEDSDGETIVNFFSLQFNYEENQLQDFVFFGILMSDFPNLILDQTHIEN